MGTGRLTRDLSNLTDAQKSLISESGLCVGVDSTGTFRMYGGTMDGTGQTSTGAGGAVTGMNENSTIQIFGGTIKGVTGNTAGCIYSNGPVLLAGGTLQGGKGNIGGVYMSDYSATAVLTLTGDATVTGNFKTDGTTVANIKCLASRFVIAGTYAGTAGLTVSSPSAGAVVGVSDNANVTNATLTVDNQEQFQVVTSGTQLKLVAPGNSVAKQIIGNDVEYYETMEQAIAAYKGGKNYLILMQDVAAATLTVPTKIDLAGHDIAEVNLTGNGKLEITDSATDDFTVEDADGYGTVPASANATAGKGYVMITEGDKVSAHRLEVILTELSLRPSAAGIYYRSSFGGDEIVKKHITTFGLALRANSAPDEAYIAADTEGKTHCEFDASSWNTGTKNSANSVILKDIMKEENGYLLNKHNAEIPVYGVPYVVLDGQMIMGTAYDYTLRQIVETVNAGFNKLSETEKTGLRELYETYETVMKTWKVDKIAEKIVD